MTNEKENGRTSKPRPAIDFGRGASIPKRKTAKGSTGTKEEPVEIKRQIHDPKKSLTGEIS